MTGHSGRLQICGSNDPFITEMRNTFGTTVVKVVRNVGTDEEAAFEAEALIQADTGSFALDTPIFSSDYVEVPDPRRGEGGVERCYVAVAKVLQAGPVRSMHRVKVEWGEAAAPVCVAPLRRLTFENLHPAVQSAAGNLFADGHFESSVLEAFKAIEVRIRALTGSSKSGAALVSDAFKADGSVLDVAGHRRRSGEDEREGFMHVFRGAMIGIRNPGAHELFKQSDPQQALEYLGFASVLHRRIDAAEAKHRAGAEG